MAQLKQEIIQTEEKLRQAKQQYKDGKISQEQFAKASVDAGIKLKAFRGELNRQTKDIATTNQKLKLAKGSYAALGEENKKLSVRLRNLADPLGKSRKEFDKLSKKIAENTGKMQKMDAAMGRYHKNVGNYASGLKGFALQMGGVMIAVQGAIMAFQQIERVISTFTDFEFAIQQVGAISGATTMELEMLEEQAKALGASTAFTASEVAGLQKELAKLGFDPTEIENMTSSILDVAFAFGDDLSQAAEQTGFVLKMFNLEAEETERVNDVMAAAFSNTALDLEKFSTAMPKVGAVANQMGFQLEDTVTMLGLLANAGFDASTAGTSLRNIFLKMADPAGELAQQLGYGITSIDQLAPALLELEEKGIDVADALDMTDKRSAAAFLTMIQGADTMDELNQILLTSQGTAASLAETMRDTLKGDIDELKSAAEGATIAFVEMFAPALRFVADVLTGTFQAFKFLFEQLSKLQPILKPIMMAFITFKGIMLAQIVATKAYAVAQGILATATVGVKNAFNALKLAMMSNPITAIIAAVVGLGTALVQLANYQDGATRRQEEMNNVRAETDEENQRQTAHLKELIKTAGDEQATMTDRKNAIDQLNESLTGLNGSLNLENINSKEMQEALKIELDNQKLQNEITQFEALRDEYINQQNEWKSEIRDGTASLADASDGFADGVGMFFKGVGADLFGDGSGTLIFSTIQGHINDYQDNIDDLNTDITNNTNKISENKRKLEEKTEVIDKEIIANKKYSNTLNSLQEKVRDYTKYLGDLTIGSAEYLIWTEKLATAKAELKEVQDSLNNSSKDNRTGFEKLRSSISDLEGKIKDYIRRGKDTTKLTDKLKLKQEKYNQIMKDYKELMIELGLETEETEKAELSLTEQIKKSALERRRSIEMTNTKIKQQVAVSLQVLQQLQLEQVEADEKLKAHKESFNKNMTDIEKKAYNEELELLEKNLQDKTKAYDNFNKQYIKDLIKHKQNEAQILTDQLTQGFKYTTQEIDGVKQIVWDETEALDEETRASFEQQLVTLLTQIEGFKMAMNSMGGDDETGQKKGWLQSEIFGETEDGEGLTGQQFLEMIDVSMQQVMGIMSAFNELRTTQATAEKERLSQIHSQEISDLEKSAEYQVATEEQKDRMLRELEHEQAMAMWKIDMEQFKQQKSFNKKMAIMEGAMAIMRIWASPSALPEPARSIMNGILTAAQIAMTGIQIATINAQNPPPMPVLEAELGAIIPEYGNGKFATGGMVDGPSHKEGGVKFGVGGKVVELEGGEAVINKRSTAMFRGQLSAMNVAGGGKKFATGGVVLDEELVKQTKMVQEFNSAIEALKQDSTVLVTEAEISDTQRSVKTIEAKSSF
ncbi:MAG: putative minor tail protein [Prokaryotic dsDNA virus sp.]|nr:MAG: putative minor tail protein [Prokaryotic dsDNA virus sp.]